MRQVRRIAAERLVKAIRNQRDDEACVAMLVDLLTIHYDYGYNDGQYADTELDE